MQDRLAGFAVVLGAVLIAAVPCRALDLSGAVIVPLPAEGVVSKAAEMLQEELAARSGLTLSIATEAPETGSAILLGTAQTLPGVNVPEKPEAYGIAVDGNRVRLAGRDERGALFAAGRLIRRPAVRDPFSGAGRPHRDGAGCGVPGASTGVSSHREHVRRVDH